MGDRQARVGVAYGEEFGGVGKPGFDESGKVEYDGAGGASGEDRGVVGDVAVEDFNIWRKRRDIAGGPNQNPHGVTLPEQRVAESSPEETGCTGHQYFHCSGFSPEEFRLVLKHSFCFL